ncbi:hypothetical protein V5P93_007404 [Actinokineospora auranticolor]|uniref:Small secreted domain DUF320 n=1 Tax=Actinokineospora auranticolor TaxID=155976 RepID=A0A2S6GS93_9PSEU|nr:hypothetical protein [Actinokineospora auranticolor]PPK68056.1 hypothetical protein CLV40_106289 [Actinokineospora auranticolor]
MQTWAKRGFQTALVTGGLLMLGTGIASADDNVNPDITPKSALDANIKVVGNVTNNSIGTVLGDEHLPEINRTISTSPREVLRAVPGGQVVTPLVDGISERALTGENAPLRANKVVGNVVVPVDVSGNAIALGGDSSVTNDSTQSVSTDRDITTTGDDRAIAGNVVDLDYTAPTQVTGNAISLLGDAESTNTASQSTSTGGDITTTGNDGAISGNVVAGQATTPVQVNGNAIGIGGNADTDSNTTSDSVVGGVITTDGVDSTLGGNGVAAPIAAPARVTGQSIGIIGNTNAQSTNATSAQAGDQAPDFNQNPTYVFSNGEDSTIGGNVVQAPLATPVTADCVSGVAVGNSDALCQSNLTTAAGGGNRTWGTDSVLGGAIGATPAAVPVSVIGNAGGVIGDANTDQNNTIDTTAGGHSRTRGHESVLGGTLVNSPVSAPVDSCANGGVLVGDTNIACENISTTSAGGDAGSTGDDSVGGGNGATTPITVPVELIDNGGAALGDADIYATETKFSSAGGDANTADDDAVLGANLVNAPIAAPVQAFGNTFGGVANTTSDTALENQISAGGPSQSSGTGGTGSGNIVQAPGVLPTQVFGSGTTVGGSGDAVASNVTSVATGGTATTDGVDGNASGNVVSLPFAGAVQGFGDNAAVLGDGTSQADNTVDSTAGSTVDTDGRDGNLAGNIVSPQLFPFVQSHGTAIAGVAGDSTATSTNTTSGSSGGDLTTNGDQGFLSGNLADLPVAGLVQPNADAVSAVGSDAVGVGDNNTSGSVGGTSTTSGLGGSLNGIDITGPTSVNAPVRDVPVEVLADALTHSTHSSDVTVGENRLADEDEALKLPAAGGLGVTEVPSLSSLPFKGIFKGLPAARSAHGTPLDALNVANPLRGGLGTAGLPGAELPGGDLLGGLPLGGLPIGGLPVNPGNLTGALNPGGLTGGLPLASGLPLGRQARADFPATVPGLDNLNNVSGAFSGNLFEAPSLNHLPVQTPALSGLDSAAALPTAGLPTAGLPGLPSLPGVSSLTDTQARLAGLFD